MQSITININTLKAALLSSAKNDTRYYLNGVLLDKAGFVVATNGHCIFVQKQDFTLSEDIILPNEMLASTLKLANKKDTTLQLDIEGPAIKMLGITFPSIDGKYPDWRRLIPTTAPSGERGYFMPDYLALGNKILAQACGKVGSPYHIHHNGDSIGSAYGRDGAYFGVMPVRNPDSDLQAPAPSTFIGV